MARRKLLAGGGLAVAMLLSLALVPGTASAAPETPVAQPEATGTVHYVDCSADKNGDGTESNPLNSLEAANGVDLKAGDQLLFKYGSTCTSYGEGENKVGLQIVDKHGAENKPIQIGAYGDAKAGKPKLEGNGVRETVLVKNSSYIEVRNLDISNADAEKADQYQFMRRGIAVINKDQGELKHFVIEGNDIHDVFGQGKKDLGGSGAMQLEVYSSSDLAWDAQKGWKVSDDGDKTGDDINHTPSWFNGTLISNNTVTNVSRSGINMSTDYKCREETAWDGGGVCNANRREDHAWTPSRNLIIRNNHLEHIGGDGIVAQMTDGAVVEGNYLAWAAEKALSNNAGIWNWNADNTLFQYNEVTNTQKIGNNDGTAWDFDYGTRNTVFQYNYSHDNAGGSMLFCGCGAWKSKGLGWATGATFRNNISVNDGYADELAEGSVNTGRLAFLSGATDATFANNTFIMPADQGSGLSLTDGGGDTTSVLFANNLFISDGAVKDENAKLEETDGNPHLKWSNNVFAGVGSGWPVPTDNHNKLVALSEFLQDAGVTMRDLRSGDLGKLDFNSTYTAGAGMSVYPEQSKDFLGHDVPTYGKPDVGAIQHSKVATGANAAQSHESIASGEDWSLTVPANATIKVTGKVSKDNELVLRRDNDWYNYKQELGYATADDTSQTGYVRFSNDGSSLSVICQPKDSKNKSGSCDNITVSTVTDDVIDGSFEAIGGSPWSLGGYLPGEQTQATRVSFDETDNKELYGPKKNEDGTPNSNYTRWGALSPTLKGFESRSARNEASVVAGEYSGQLGMIAPLDDTTNTFFVDTLNQRNIPVKPGATYTLGFWTVLGASRDDTVPQVSATVKYRAAGSGTGASFSQYKDLDSKPLVFQSATTDAKGKNVKAGAKLFVTGTFTVPADAAPEGSLWISIAQPNLAENGKAYIDDVTLVRQDEAPTVSVTGQTVDVVEGQTISAFATSAGQPAVSYRWFKQNGDSWTEVRTTTANATGNGAEERTNWLTVDKAELEDAGTYKVVVTNAYGQTAESTITVKVTDNDQDNSGNNGGNSGGESTGGNTGGNTGNEGGTGEEPGDKPGESVESVTMLRLYNPNTGEHFYTASMAERDNLVSFGWKFEGIGWVAPASSDAPVFRLFNPNAKGGDHHYTMDAAERDNLVAQGWKYEGIGWYSDETKTVPVYRQYNPNALSGAHNYTPSKLENDNLVKLGWNAEGIGWYALSAQ